MVAGPLRKVIVLGSIECRPQIQSDCLNIIAYDNTRSQVLRTFVFSRTHIANHFLTIRYRISLRVDAFS
jgi:hypothetical protein